MSVFFLCQSTSSFVVHHWLETLNIAPYGSLSKSISPQTYKKKRKKKRLEDANRVAKKKMNRVISCRSGWVVSIVCNNLTFISKSQLLFRSLFRSRHFFVSFLRVFIFEFHFKMRYCSFVWDLGESKAHIHIPRKTQSQPCNILCTFLQTQTPSHRNKSVTVWKKQLKFQCRKMSTTDKINTPKYAHTDWWFQSLKFSIAGIESIAENFWAK